MLDIQRALASYGELTNGCITFRERTPEDANYVAFTSIFGGCFSEVGMIGGPQIVNYQNPGCTRCVGNIAY